MRLLSTVNIRVKKGFLPHLANEVYKKYCEIRRSVLVENQGDFDLFKLEISYSSKEKFKGLMEKIAKHESNFQIISFENDLEEQIKNGLLTVSGKIEIENMLDYEMKIQAVSELALDIIESREEGRKYAGISKNIGLVSGIRMTDDSDRNILKSYINMERDSVIVNRFSGLNAFPFIIKFNEVDDFIKTLQRIENTFSAVRLCNLEEIDDIAIYEQVFSDCGLPILSQYYDEIPAALMAAIFHLLEKNKIDTLNKNVGFIGLNAASMRITRLLLKSGFYRILGCDSNVKLMHGFEKQGGLATTQENIFSNSDIVVLFKDYFSEGDFKKIGSGQIVISLIDSPVDTVSLRAKGVREILSYGWMDLAVIFPGILKGLLSSGVKRLDDEMIIKLSKRIVELKSKDEILPNVFSDVHEKLENFVRETS